MPYNITTKHHKTFRRAGLLFDPIIPMQFATLDDIPAAVRSEPLLLIAESVDAIPIEPNQTGEEALLSGSTNPDPGSPQLGTEGMSSVAIQIESADSAGRALLAKQAKSRAAKVRRAAEKAKKVAENGGA